MKSLTLWWQGRIRTRCPRLKFCRQILHCPPSSMSRDPNLTLTLGKQPNTFSGIGSSTKGIMLGNKMGNIKLKKIYSMHFTILLNHIILLNQNILSSHFLITPLKSQFHFSAILLSLSESLQHWFLWNTQGDLENYIYSIQQLAFHLLAERSHPLVHWWDPLPQDTTFLSFSVWGLVRIFVFWKCVFIYVFTVAVYYFTSLNMFFMFVQYIFAMYEPLMIVDSDDKVF